jgi:hypothetical protein
MFIIHHYDLICIVLRPESVEGLERYVIFLPYTVPLNSMDTSIQDLPINVVYEERTRERQCH